MDVIYSDKLRQGDEKYALLQQVTTRLEEAIGPSANRVKAEWDRTEDERHRPLYTLRISDPTATATTSFAPDELAASPHLRFRLHRLWGDLLQVRSHQQLDDLQGNGDPED